MFENDKDDTALTSLDYEDPSAQSLREQNSNLYKVLMWRRKSKPISQNELIIRARLLKEQQSINLLDHDIKNGSLKIDKQKFKVLSIVQKAINDGHEDTQHDSSFRSSSLKMNYMDDDDDWDFNPSRKSVFTENRTPEIKSGRKLNTRKERQNLKPLQKIDSKKTIDDDDVNFFVRKKYQY